MRKTPNLNPFSHLSLPPGLKVIPDFSPFSPLQWWLWAVHQTPLLTLSAMGGWRGQGAGKTGPCLLGCWGNRGTGRGCMSQEGPRI